MHMNPLSGGQRVPRRKNPFELLVLATGLSVGVAAFLIGLFVAYDVVARSVFRLSNSWVTELTMYLMGYITFVGAAYALCEGAHVGVDMLAQKLPPRASRLLGVLASVVMLLVVASLTWLGFQFFRDAWTSNERSDTLLSVRLWIPYLSFFLGMLWLLIVLVERIASSLRPGRDKEERR
jgi:TRAP-type C4-dicarboxylate transport system permease small subunit